MKRTLVLVVDRDDDFGVKGGVETPAVGLEAVSRAARMLGVADPEDSDLNTIYAAIKIYNEMKAEDKHVEVALICGDTKVGHKSDMMIADELEAVIKTVRPDRAVLVSDGAEDEYVYPIITSRLKVDSVKKVYVKQAPGFESAFYALTKIMRDNDKRKRLLAPIGIILMAITIILMIPVFISYRDTGNLSHIYNATGIFTSFAIGAIVFLYAYRVGDLMSNFVRRTLSKIKSGDPTVIFALVAAALVMIGIALGVFAAIEPGLQRGHRIIIFFSNSLWVMVFAYICNDFGKFIERYMEKKDISLGFMVGTLMIFSVAFVLQGALDILAVVFDYNIIVTEMIIIEFAIGFAFAAAAGMTQISYKRFLNSRKAAELSDALE
ncbi:MAG: DUF373 family protein [Methanomassiliicoccaceae archaeon]|jgi:putative membrane protein|nr:DUF373 family protein [Methanomassiliicoccaceae archaeon]